VTPRKRLDQLLETHTGIEVTRGGIDANIDAFLAARVRHGEDLETYLGRLGSSSAELELLINAMTVTHSWFFRDAGQMGVLRKLLEDAAAARQNLRVWVAGCATGEDAYSIAILAEQTGAALEILGTDINSIALASAKRGTYAAWSVREMPDVAPYFRRLERGAVAIEERLKASVKFERHNLLEPPPPGIWDVILCRNVLIYLSRERSMSVVERLAESLSEDGYLLLGASEVVFDVPPQLEATYVAGRLAFRRRTTRSGERREAPSKSLIPSAPAGFWHAPLPVVPRAAASILEPKSPPLSRSAVAELLDRGHAALDAAELVDAIAAYERAVELDPTSAEPHMYLGIALYLHGHLEPALHELRGANFLDASLWPAAFYLAVCHEALGQLPEAAREYRHVVRIAEQPIKSVRADRHSAWHSELIELARRRASASGSS
jgi:chemotaxis protein methyltransferase CheR